MFSTRQAAKMLGITHATLSRYITAGKVAEPQAVTSGGMTIHLWSEADIERVRKLLPKIKNGRKTRYQKKQQSALSSLSRRAVDQQSGKAKTKQKGPKKK